jgi:TMEM175 potassium channel family protein
MTCSEGRRASRDRRTRTGADQTPHVRYLRTIGEGSALERTIAFSDAVFAIAMTILVLELRVPEVGPAGLSAALLELVPAYLTFALSFLVVGIIWLSHHRKFSVIVRYDQRLLRINLVMLLLVASLAFPTGLLGRFGDQLVSVVLYAALISGIGFLMSVLWIYAWHRGLIDERVDEDVFRYVLTQSLPIPGVFLLSIPVALLAGPAAGESTWILALPLSIAVPRFHDWRTTRRQR